MATGKEGSRTFKRAVLPESIPNNTGRTCHEQGHRLPYYTHAAGMTVASLTLWTEAADENNEISPSTNVG